MTEFIKKQGIGFYLSVLASILGIVSLIIYIANATTVYYNDYSAPIVAVTIFAILLSCGAAVMSQFEFAQLKIVKIAIDIMLVLSAFLLIWAVTMFIGSRVESLAYVFGSDLESDNAAAQSGTRQAIAGFVLYFIAWFATVVGAFFSITKKAK